MPCFFYIVVRRCLLLHHQLVSVDTVNFPFDRKQTGLIVCVCVCVCVSYFDLRHLMVWRTDPKSRTTCTYVVVSMLELSFNISMYSMFARSPLFVAFSLPWPASRRDQYAKALAFCGGGGGASICFSRIGLVTQACVACGVYAKWEEKCLLVLVLLSSQNSYLTRARSFVLILFWIFTHMYIVTQYCSVCSCQVKWLDLWSIMFCLIRTSAQHSSVQLCSIPLR